MNDTERMQSTIFSNGARWRAVAVHGALLLGCCAAFSTCTTLTDVRPRAAVPAVDDPTLTLPVLSIRVDPVAFEEMLFRHGEDIELDAELDLYRNGVRVLTGEAIELEVKGGVSAAYPLKSLGIKFDEAISNADRRVLSPPVVLPRHQLDELRALRLRNGGNDFYGAQLKDLVYTRLAIGAGLDVDPMYGEPCLVYINDEFYALYRLRSEGNTRGMAGLNGVKKRDITLGKVTWPGLFAYKDGDTTRLAELFTKAWMRDTAYLKTALDLDHFIDYCAFQGFIGNEDWPANNVRFYAVGDGPFRCVLYDLDLAAYLKPAATPLEIITYERFENPLRNMFLALYETPDFRRRFDARLRALYEDPNLTPAAFDAIVDGLRDEMLPYLPLQIDRWEAPSGTVSWEAALETLRSDYARRYALITD